MATKLIVGLGNPGNEYAGTRHNAGRQLIEFISSRHQLSISRQKTYQAYSSEFDWEGHRVILAYPDLYMNLSGEAVKKLVDGYKIDIRENLLVLVDDAAIAFGTFRLRAKGSDGGHNGLKSVSHFLGTKEYPRLRIGVGVQEVHPLLTPGDRISGLKLKEYVLDSYTSAERKLLEGFLSAGEQACRLWVASSIDKAMSAVNKGGIKS